MQYIIKNKGLTKRPKKCYHEDFFLGTNQYSINQHIRSIPTNTTTKNMLSNQCFTPKRSFISIQISFLLYFNHKINAFTNKAFQKMTHIF